MRRYPERSGVNGTVAGSRYIRGMMFNRLSKISARSFTTAFAVSAVAGLAGASVALAQSYPPPPGYSQPVQPAPYDARDDRGMPDFDRLDGDDRGTALSPPGYQQQPNYQQSAPQQQSYQQQPGLDPRGPVMSPDDPRYGRTTVYSDRGPAPAYGDRGPMQLYPDQAPPPNGDSAMRPPGAIDGGATGAVQQPGQGTAMGANGRSVMAALPPEEQPETGPRKELPERLRRLLDSRLHEMLPIRGHADEIAAGR